jgi:hypothetical protein
MVRCSIETKNHFISIAKCLKTNCKLSLNETQLTNLLLKYSKLIPKYNEHSLNSIINFINKPKQRIIGEETEKKLFTNILIAKLINELKNQELDLEPSRDLKEFKKFLEELIY